MLCYPRLRPKMIPDESAKCVDEFESSKLVSASSADTLDDAVREMTVSETSSETGERSESDGKSEELTISSDSADEPVCKGVDSILDYLGHFGRFQRLLYFSLWLPAASMAAGVYASVYMESDMDFTCAQDLEADGHPPATCFRSDNVSECSEWSYDRSVFTETVVSEFNLVCGRSFVKTLSKTIYMLGMLVGSFVFGWVGDKLGRKVAFLATSLCLSLGSLGCALAPNVEFYIASRFVTSCGGMGIFITVFVLAMEFIGPKFRTITGVAIQIPFALGELYIVLLAYLIRDWRIYQAVVGGPFFLFLFYLFFIPESVRWLISKQKTEEAKKVLDRVAKVNKVIMPVIQEEEEQLQENPEMSETKKSVGMTDMFTNTTLCTRFFVMALNWVVATLGYYGLGLSSASLTDDPFSSFALSAAMEVPAYLFCVLCLDKAGRKTILAASQILAGSAILAAAALPSIPFLPAWVVTVLTLAGKFGASAAFAIVFVFTAELFPTPVRNTALGLCSTSARIGGLVAPYIASLSATSPLLPFIIMGTSSCVGGAAALLLPETSGLPLPDTVEEAVAISHRRKYNYRSNVLTSGELLENNKIQY